MIEVLSCPSCDAQFESNGPGTRCPVCGTRGEARTSRRDEPHDSQRRSGAAFSFSSNGGGFRAVSWGGGKGLVLAIFSGLLSPFLFASGLIAIALGTVLDVDALLTLGFVLMTIAGVAFAFVLWKLWRGFRGARRAWQAASGRTVFDEDRVAGRWERTDAQ